MHNFVHQNLLPAPSVGLKTAGCFCVRGSQSHQLSFAAKHAQITERTDSGFRKGWIRESKDYGKDYGKDYLPITTPIEQNMMKD